MESEIISIGTELLLGEIVDTNTRTIAMTLRSLGIDLYRSSTVGDNVDRIADAVKSGISRSDIIITTGGLGPTVDDATREGIAKAFGLEAIFSEELWEQVQTRFASFGRKPTENNRRQAYIPEGALPIENPVGTAPGFIVEHGSSCAIALPGVPAEMSYLLENAVVPYLKKKYRLKGLIKSKRIRTAGIGESTLAQMIGDLEHLSNPTVGFSAHPGRVDIRITAKADTEAEVDEMIWKIEATIRQRIGDLIYGIDEETLESVVLQEISKRGWRLGLVEFGSGGALAHALTLGDETFAGGQILRRTDDKDDILPQIYAAFDQSTAEVNLGSALVPSKSKLQHTIIIQLPSDTIESTRTFPSTFTNIEERAVSVSVNTLRKALLQMSEGE